MQKRSHKSSYQYDASAEKTGGPRRYEYPWKPLGKQERAPTRPGSEDYKALRSIGGATAISRPVEVSRVVLGPGSWDVTYSDGSVRTHVDLTAELWKLDGGEMA